VAPSPFPTTTPPALATDVPPRFAGALFRAGGAGFPFCFTNANPEPNGGRPDSRTSHGQPLLLLVPPWRFLGTRSVGLEDVCPANRLHCTRKSTAARSADGARLIMPVPSRCALRVPGHHLMVTPPPSPSPAAANMRCEALHQHKEGAGMLQTGSQDLATQQIGNWVSAALKKGCEQVHSSKRILAASWCF
jgi:hypothetical protein